MQECRREWMPDACRTHSGLDHELLDVQGFATFRTRLPFAGPTLLSRLAADLDLLLDFTPIATVHERVSAGTAANSSETDSSLRWCVLTLSHY